MKSAAEDAALLEAMSEVEQDEQDQESLTDLELSDEQVNALTKSGIKNKDDLAELATDELMEIIDISEDSASEMIMKARSIGSNKRWHKQQLKILQRLLKSLRKHYLKGCHLLDCLIAVQQTK